MHSESVDEQWLTFSSSVCKYFSLQSIRDNEEERTIEARLKVRELQITQFTGECRLQPLTRLSIEWSGAMTMFDH